MTVEPLIPIRAIEHHAYCPRQCALIHVDGVWTDNVHTLRGQRGHRRVDGDADRQERGRRVLRSLPLWSETLGLTGRADAVEVHPDGSVAPVEYKIGTRHGDAAVLRLCAQALCIEEMLGIDVPVGFVWYSTHRRRDPVEVDARLREATTDAIAAIRDTFADPVLPPAVDDARCGERQLLGHCLPDVVAHTDRLGAYMQQELVGCGS